MKKSKKLSCKALSLCMVVAMIAVSVPFAFAATTLSASNVTQWPTLSYNSEDGKMYYGQTIGEALIINDDEIVLDADGNQVAGHFEFIDPTLMQLPGTNIKSHIQFVPDDTDAYTGFQKKRSSLLYNVETVTPVYVDEVNDPLTATKVEAGATLRTSTISGGKMTNPYNPDEPEISGRSWEWSKPDTVVTESGYYEAKFVPAGYTVTTAQVYVAIAVDIIESEISAIPIIPELIYDGVTTWSDITLSGGAAVEKGTTNVIEGTFALTELWKATVIDAGTYEIDATFTPNDTEAYTRVNFKIPVTVTKAPIKFVDENGNDIVPEITVPYGTKFTDISRFLMPYVKGADYTLLSMGDLEYKQCEEGTYTITASAPSDGKHYETTELTFKIVIEKIKINPSLKALPGEMYIEDNSAVYKPKGTFTIEYTIDGVEQTPITGIQYNTHFEWNPTKSGNYEYTVIYNEAEENEYFIIDDFTTSNPVKLMWSFSATGSVDGTYTYGDEVTLEAPATDPEKADKPYYGFVKWEDANGNTGLSEEELESREITFTMPDGEVDLNATYEFDFCLMIQYWFSRISAFFNSFFASLGTLF